MDRHRELLRQMCRVSGCKFSNIAKKGVSKKYAVSDHITELESCFPTIKKDQKNADVYPELFCASCMAVVRRYKNAQENKERYARISGGGGVGGGGNETVGGTG